MPSQDPPDIMDDITDEARDAKEKLNVNLYLNKALYEEFRAICDAHKLVPSSVIDSFMRRFNQSKRAK